MTAHPRTITLDDKYGLESGVVYLSGIQALVRVALDRSRLDRAAGLSTGGLISGYRGSPLGGFDQELARARHHLEPRHIVVRSGVNEELGAAAVWGSQKIGLAGEGSDFDGVFGIWYGKAPGVDRAGDALRQANAAGTARHGGVLALAGDDPLAKSSVLPAQSEFFFMHVEMPVLNPADVQEVVDYGLHGLEMSRYSGLWTALICVADTMDASGLVEVGPQRYRFVRPAKADPRSDEEVNRLLLLKNRLETERLLRDIRLPAARAYVRANGLDHVAFGSSRPRLGLVTTGKAYRDLRQALELLGIDERRASELGIAIYKVAMPWPLEPVGLSTFVRGLERVMVVEHKRPLIESQVKEILYHWPESGRPRIYGKTTPEGTPFLSDLLELSCAEIVQALMSFIPGASGDAAMRAVADRLVERSAWAAGHAERAARTPYFCSGCPHNTSTVIPEGARALPGIGCHAMTEISGRTTDSQIFMGGEGALWVGQQPFSKDAHVFANLGDGTYYHSGILAIRQAVASRVPITYKILYNDAVAMTGGQKVDGPLTVTAMARQLLAEGVERVTVVSERPQLYRRGTLAEGVEIEHRDALQRVQEEMAAIPAVTAIIYDQTCAAEKRRRRRKGTYEDPARRVFINARLCEGCGDCSVQSNCLSVEPLATEFGEKRRIKQSSCNKDYSCVKGFCPSFLIVEGAQLRRRAGAGRDLAALADALPQPDRAPPTRTLNVLVTGIGGMGVTTTGAVLAMAAHIDGLRASTLDMTGLAQKGGPVTSHLRLARREGEIEGPRIPVASLDVLLACDVLVASTGEHLSLLDPERTVAVANTHVAPSAEFVMRQTLSFDETRMMRTLQEGTKAVHAFDADGIAEHLLGDAIHANMLLVGTAFQKGLLPLSLEAVTTAIRLNGVAVEANLAAFAAGRLLAANPTAILGSLPAPKKPREMSLAERVAFLAGELEAYQDRRYADRFRALVAKVHARDEACGSGSLRLTRTVAENLYRLMAAKDEYEVARLYLDPAFQADLEEAFEAGGRVSVLLAPPLFARTDPDTGRPRKMAFRRWIFLAFRILVRARRLRGTWADPFGHTHERRTERQLLRAYEADIERIVARIGVAEYGLLCELARVPDAIRGYGPVKAVNIEKAQARRAALLSRLERPLRATVTSLEAAE